MRYQTPTSEASESNIVRDLLYVFQGIDGQSIKFELLADAFVLSPKITVSPSTHKIISELCEVGWLYKRVNDWLQKNSREQHLSQVVQSLCFAIQAELAEYYRLIAVLEHQRNSFQPDDSANYLNLRKLYLWIQEPLERLKWLAIICDSVKGLKGGAICSAIHSYILTGSPQTKHFITRIIREVSCPILRMIKEWMLEGEINDPYSEFFIEVNPNVSDDKLWTDKYKLNYIMIPAYFTNELAKKILQTGKSVNFIRRCCQLQGWTLHMSTQSLFDLENGLDINRLQQWVNEACEKTNSELLSIIFSKYHFEQHCLYLKKYLLLGQGDLMEYLMDLMNDVLEKPAKQIYKQQLRSILDTAIRSSNAQYHPQEFISRLDVKLLEGS